MAENQSKTEMEKPIEPEVIELAGGVIDSIEGETVRVQYGGANQITATDVEIYQGGALTVQSENMRLDRSTGLLLKSNTAISEGSNNAVVIGDQIQVNESRIGVAVTNQATISNSSTIFLFAREMHGSVETVFDRRSAAALGVAAGVVLGFLGLLSRRFGRRG
ncbi:MAG: hypothetical protein JXA25_03460 [Anaerolineales bacterium]|nr:hypothetical protein [Anaerolineales bacterium]